MANRGADLYCAPVTVYAAYTFGRARAADFPSVKPAKKLHSGLAFGMALLYNSSCALKMIFLSSSAVEHPAVNRRVVGSNPTWGASGIHDPDVDCIAPVGVDFYFWDAEVDCLFDFIVIIASI